MREIAFLLPDEVQLLDLAGPHDVFTAANQALSYRKTPKSVHYKLTLLSHQKRITVSGGQAISVGDTEPFSTFNKRVDTLIVLSGPAFDRYHLAKRSEWIARFAPRARRIVSICTGAFALAEAGLLNGKRAATHWLYCKEFAARFPEVTVDSESIYIKQGSIYTSAGVTAGIDLALALVEEDHGPEVALLVAKGLVVYMRRPGTQRQFSHLLEEQYKASGPLADLIPWMQNNLSRSLSVETLAQRCAMSPRSFARHFVDSFAMTPARFVAKLRLETARRLLTDSELSIEEISRKCGFGNADVFRKSFGRALEMTPVEYRKIWANSC
jgi:transcriptional regulator GlxA family with amidase domain